MKSLLLAAEMALGVLVDVLTIPMLLLGLFTGLRGSMRYFRIKSM